MSVGRPGGNNVSAGSVRPVRGDVRGLSQMSMGHRLGGDDYWNGYIKDLVAGPSMISKKMFPILVRQGLTPNPMDDDGLRDKLGRSFLTVAPTVLGRGEVA